MKNMLFVQAYLYIYVLLFVRLKPLLEYPWVKEVRGKGLLCAIELKNDAPQTAWNVCLQMADDGVYT